MTNKGDSKIKIGSNWHYLSQGGTRVVDFKITWIYQQPTRIEIILANQDGLFSLGGSKVVTQGDEVRFYLWGTVDTAMELYMLGEVMDLEAMDDGTLILGVRSFYHKAKGMYPNTVFNENYVDGEYLPIDVTGPIEIDLANASNFVSADTIISPPDVYVLSDKAPRNLGKYDTKVLLAFGDVHAQKFTAKSERVDKIILCLENTGGTITESYEFGICPTDGAGNPAHATPIASQTLIPVVVGQCVWLEFAGVTIASGNIQRDKEYWVYAKRTTNDFGTDALYWVCSNFDRYEEFWYWNGAAWAILAGQWALFAAYGFHEEDWEKIKYDEDYVVTSRYVRFQQEGMTYTPPRQKCPSGPTGPKLSYVRCYFRDDNAKVAISAHLREMIKMGWKDDVDENVNVEFDSTTKYRMPLYYLNGISLLDAFVEMAGVTDKLAIPAGDKAQIYTAFTEFPDKRKFYFVSEAEVTDAAQLSLNADNSRLDANGATLNPDLPAGQVLNAEFENLQVDRYDAIRVIPAVFSDIAEVRDFGIYPDWGDIFEEIDQGLSDYNDAYNRAEELADALSTDLWTGEIKISGWYPHFDGRPLACGDIIEFKGEQHFGAAIQKFKVTEVEITSDYVTVLRVTSNPRVEAVLKRVSDRIKELERIQAPQGIRDIVIHCRRVEADTIVGAPTMQLRAGAVVILTVTATKRARTGHNTYHGFFTASWTSPTTPLIDNIKLTDGAFSHTFDLEDLTEDSWIKDIEKWGPTRVVVNFVIGLT